MSNPIPTENANTGTTAWICTQASTTQIQVWCDKQSYNPSDTVNFYCSTQSGGTGYTIYIYRLGYYGGTGGCLKATISGRTGTAQGYWNASNTTLNNCPTAYSDNTTKLLESGWSSTDSWSIPANAVTGVYVAQFQDANGYQHYCSFVVKGNSPADYCYVRGVTADFAYNDWGGNSLYTTPGTSVKVSLNRPIVQGRGTHGVFLFEMNAIKWFESQGYNLSYLTNIDIHTNPSLILNYRAYISPGHDEYWTREMRDGLESAITQGVGAAFLGANACYWQCRLENDHTGTTANRTVTCYKCDAATPSTLYTDPFFLVDNTRVTTQWRKWPVLRPENTMIGIMYSSLLSSQGNDVANVNWTTASNATSQSFVGGTGLANSTNYGYDLVGYEYDKQFPNGPSNLQIIGNTNVTDSSGVSDWSNTTVYQTPSGAWIFASGSVNWTGALDTYRYVTQGGGTPATISAMQTLMSNVMTALIGGKTQPNAKYNVFSSHR